MSNLRILQDVVVYNSLTASGDVYVTDNLMANSLALGVLSSTVNPDPTKTLYVSGDTYITGTLTVAGSSNFVNTTFTTSSALSVVNMGTGPAVVGVQVGEEAIAAFYDDSNIALWIDGNSSRPGFVGIGTKEPNKKLTVIGDISATGRIFGDRNVTKFVSAFGNDTDTVYTINHDLDVQDVVSTVINTNTFEVVYPLVTYTNFNEITVEFSEVPGLTAYKIIVVG
jgi:hypothetical protein